MHDGSPRTSPTARHALAFALVLTACSGSGDAPSPDVPDVPVAIDVPDVPIVIDVSDVSVAIDVPDISDVSVAIDVPDVPVAIDVPDASIAIDVPDVPIAIDVPVVLPWERPLSASALPSQQLNVGNDAWRSWLFANLLRMSDAWILGGSGVAIDPTAADALAAAVTVDAHGWPTALPTGREVQIHAGYSTGEAVNPDSGTRASTFLHGVFVLT